MRFNITASDDPNAKAISALPLNPVHSRPRVRMVAMAATNTRDSLRERKSDQLITDPLLPGFSSPVVAFFELT